MDPGAAYYQAVMRLLDGGREIGSWKLYEEPEAEGLSYQRILWLEQDTRIVNYDRDEYRRLMGEARKKDEENGR